MAETVSFDGARKNKVALIVRGKLNRNHSPGLNSQHADVVLTNGEPCGFFGEGGGISGWAGDAKAGALKRALGAMRMKGAVYNYRDFESTDQAYINAAEALRAGKVSTVLVIDGLTA